MVLIDLVLMLDILGVYATLDFSRHLLLVSTLLNNYSTTNLVNNRALLVLDTFIKVRVDKCVKARSLSLLILGRSKRVLKNILDRVKGPRTKDLVLKDVVIVEGFHVNIVLEARIRTIGV